MDQFLEFFGNHIALFVALFAIAGMLAWTILGSAGAMKVSPAAATQLINDEDAIVVDVRGDGEFRDGHIVNAINIPVSALSEQLDKLEKHRHKPIISSCRTGQQAATACSLLRKNGFEKAYALGGGILAWRDANLPLTKK